MGGTAGSSGDTSGLGGSARFYAPRGIALDPSGNLFIGGGASPASVTSTQTEKIADTATVTVNANGSFLPGATETIGGLILDGGTVNSSASVLSVDGNLTANQNVHWTRWPKAYRPGFGGSS